MTTTPHAPSKKSDMDRKIGLEIKAWLARKELRQADLASALGVNQGQVSQRLLGKISFSVEELMKISGYLDLSLGELIGLNLLNEKGPDPRNENRGPSELLQLDLNQQPFDYPLENSAENFYIHASHTHVIDPIPHVGYWIISSTQTIAS